MFARIVAQVVEFAEEFDFYGIMDNCASITQFEAETADLMQTDPGALIAYLRSFDNAPEWIIEAIEEYAE